MHTFQTKFFTFPAENERLFKTTQDQHADKGVQELNQLADGLYQNLEKLHTKFDEIVQPAFAAAAANSTSASILKPPCDIGFLYLNQYQIAPIMNNYTKYIAVLICLYQKLEEIEAKIPELSQNAPDVEATQKKFSEKVELYYTHYHAKEVRATAHYLNFLDQLIYLIESDIMPEQINDLKVKEMFQIDILKENVKKGGIRLKEFLDDFLKNLPSSFNEDLTDLEEIQKILDKKYGSLYIPQLQEIFREPSFLMDLSEDFL